MKLPIPKKLALFALTLGLMSTGLGNLYAQTSPACAVSLHDSTEAYAIRRKLIRSAEKEIIMNYFSFREDKLTYELFALLAEASARNVSVKIILDPWSSKISTTILRFLDSRGVKVKFYNPMRKFRNIINFSHRDHDKFFIIDKSILLVGGRNLKIEYFERRPDLKHSFFDMDALFRGQAAVQALTYFNDRWDSKWVENALTKKYSQDHSSEFEAKVQEAQDELDKVDPDPRRMMRQQSPEAHAAMAAHLKNQIISEDCSDLVFNHPDDVTKLTNGSVEADYIKLVNAANESIDIVNPYIVFTKKMKAAISDALDRNVRIRIFTNSVHSNDMLVAQAAYLNDRKKLLKMGIELHEFMDDLWTLHSKVAVFDHKIALIGSFNLDPRSAYLNSEVFLTSTDPNAVDIIQYHVGVTESLSKKIMMNGKPENSSVKHPGATFVEKMNVFFLRALAPLFRGQL